MINIFEKIKKFVHNPLLIFPYAGQLKLLNWMSDELYLKLSFRASMGYSLNLKTPVTFNEKLQWLKIHDKNPIYTQMVDKYLVREYLKNKLGGDEYLIPLLGVWDTVDEIDFEKLPNQFVLKPTHDSGTVVICNDKTQFDKNAAKKKLSKALTRDYYYSHREWPYKNVPKKIIAEKYMVDDVTGELYDYKFMCFNGKVKCLNVCTNRHSKSGLNVTFFDREWKRLPFYLPLHPPDMSSLKKPDSFEMMVEIAEKISSDSKSSFLRVDFYEVNAKLYIGELTFYPFAGLIKYSPNEWDKKMGDWLVLPTEKNQ